MLKITDSRPTPLPESVRIGPFTYRIDLIGIVDDNDPRLVGEIRYGEDRILISTMETPLGRWDTLIHEVLHAISRLVPENLQLSEAHIEAFTPYLTSFLLDIGFLRPETLTGEEDRERLDLIDRVREKNGPLDGC